MQSIVAHDREEITEMDIVQEALIFLKATVSRKILSYETIHPWRSRGEFIVHHALRVEAYARQIWQAESYGEPESESLLRIAALLHDIGGLEGRKNHAERGAAIAREWLQDHPLSQQSKDRIVHMIADHSNKAQPNGDILSDIFKDADILDEIGAISIFMASNWIERTSSDFFLLLSEKLKDREIAFCEKQMQLLTTNTAKAILRRKQVFIEHFIKELDFELTGTEHLLR
jgi:putative nucleotidyltransferase with HDIG domain